MSIKPNRRMYDYSTTTSVELVSFSAFPHLKESSPGTPTCVTPCGKGSSDHFSRDDIFRREGYGTGIAKLCFRLEDSRCQGDNLAGSHHRRIVIVKKVPAE